MERIKDSNAAKRLNLIYLANEVVQQSKARKRDDFLIAFSPLMADAVAIGFRGAGADIRNKIKRVVEVWRQRNIFEEHFQSAAEARLKDLETSQSAGGRKLMGGSLFSSNAGPGPAAPAEIKPLIPLQEKVSQSELDLGDLVQQAEKDAKDVTENPASQAPLRIARYHKALKSLSQAEAAVANGIKARLSLVEQLEKLAKVNRDTIAEAESRLSVFREQTASIGDLKQRDENDVMRGHLSNTDESDPAQSNGGEVNKSEPEDADRPPTEELTPPPMEDFTPVGSPAIDKDSSLKPITENMPQDVAWDLNESSAAGATGWNTPEPGADLLASLSRPFSTTDMANDDTSSKKQRIDEASSHLNSTLASRSIPGLGDDVDQLITSEKNGA